VVLLMIASFIVTMLYLYLGLYGLMRVLSWLDSEYQYDPYADEEIDERVSH
jgi:hypothetical protein